MYDQIRPIFLMMDIFRFERRDPTSDIYPALNSCIRWLPSHSHHFLQPLDFGLFARLKMKSREQQVIKTEPKWLSEIIRIHRSWYEYYALIRRWFWRLALPQRSFTHAPRLPGSRSMRFQFAENWISNALAQ
jgi:hypothetical protein